MVTRAENDLMTRVEGDAPLGRLMRENYWIPFALSEQPGGGRRTHAGAPVRRELRRLPAPTAASDSSTSCARTATRRSSSRARR